MMFHLNLNQQNMSRYQKQLSSSGKRIFRPSDDPVGISRVLKYSSDVNILKQFKSTVSAAEGHNRITESSVTAIKDILQTIRQHCVAAADHTKTEDDIKKYKIEIEQLKQELIILGNATNGSKYVFSGLETDKRLFNEDGTYHLLMTSQRIDEKPVMEYEVTVGERVRVGIHPVDLFGAELLENPMKDLMPRGTAKSISAKRPEVNMNVDTEKGYDGKTIKVTVDGTDYTVDTSGLHNTYLEPMDKKRFLFAMSRAVDAGGHRLSDVADVFFDENDRLVLRNKAAGAGKTISIATTSPDITGITSVAGADGEKGVYSAADFGGTNLTDAAIAGATGKQSIALTYRKEGKSSEQLVIELDFDTLNTVADVQTALQAKLDAKFPPANTIKAVATAGQPLKFEVAEGEIAVDSVLATKSKMMADIDNLIKALGNGRHDVVNEHIAIIDKHLDTSLAVLGEIGGKTNRYQYIDARIAENTLTFSDLMDQLKYADFAEMITLFKNMENVYRASLSVGSKVIQPSLVDFIR